jgi:hypothetical protein
MQFYAAVLVLGVIASLLVFAARDSAWLTAWVR